jgi:hypothetical protein
MIGLKTYLSRLASLLGQRGGWFMLYERQRALAKEGLLKVVPGRGPGSGVRADEEAVSVLLISLLANDLLIHMGIVDIFCRLTSDQGKCPVTGAPTFQEAVQRILGDEELAGSVAGLSVRRSDPASAQIQFKKAGNKIIDSSFKMPIGYVPGKKTARKLELSRVWSPPEAIEASYSVKPAILQQIAKDIAKIKKDEPL